MKDCGTRASGEREGPWGLKRGGGAWDREREWWGGRATTATKTSDFRSLIRPVTKMDDDVGLKPTYGHQRCAHTNAPLHIYVHRHAHTHIHTTPIHIHTRTHTRTHASPNPLSYTHSSKVDWFDQLRQSVKNTKSVNFKWSIKDALFRLD